MSQKALLPQKALQCPRGRYNVPVQVPAHALQQGGSSGSTLQQVLTQAITQALSLPAEHAAMFLQTQINQAFRL